MNNQRICKKDCIHLENKTCKLGYHTINSVFNFDQKNCIYYASAFPKNQTIQLQEYF